MIGTRLAHYEIVALLGKGGMGEVYRARDTKLEREVALKVLPAMADHGGERLARFQQEARVIAGLTHPNIVTLHSVEEVEGVPFLTMELVEGESLTARVGPAGLPLDRLLEWAIPLADAVAFAHKRGITHRDLKPDNVMIDGNGRVKVLDFGLAKLLEVPEMDSLTRTVAVHRTQEGRILGTAAYMSPEQAEGKTVDTRSDVFALGIVLYEMATGRRPFEGETAISTISSIMKDQPTSALEINRGLPRQLGRILDRCLAKDPERRYQSALELRNELEVLDRESKSGELEAWVVPEGAPERGRRRPLWPVLVLVAAGIAFLAGRTSQPSPPGGLGVHSTQRLTEQGAREHYPSLARDGRLFVYTASGDGDEDVFLQRRGGQRPINLTADHPGKDRRPALSPDGEWVAFESSRQGGGVYVMGATGEAVRRLAPDAFQPAWSPDGRRIAYTDADWTNPFGRDDEGRLFVIDAAGGEPVAITPAEMDAVQPDWSGDGRWIIFWGVRGKSGQRDLWRVRPDGTDLHLLTDDAPLDWSPRSGPDDAHVYFLSNRGGTNNLWRIAVDPDAGRTRGVPEPVTLAATNVERFDLSVDASEIVYSSVQVTSQAHRVDLTVSPPGVEPITQGAVYVGRPSVSPDEQWIAFYNTTDLGAQDLFVMRIDGSDLRRVTNDTYRDRGVAWTPDGQRLVFYSDRSGSYEIWTCRPDGSDPRQISDLAGLGLDSQWYPEFSHDGRFLAVTNESGGFVWEVDALTGLLSEMRVLEPPVGGHFFLGEWDPTGNRLVGWIGNLPSMSTEGLWLHDLDTGEWRKLPMDDRGLNWPDLAFSADGRRLFVVADGRITSIDLLGDRSEVLLDGLGSTDGASLLRDGRALVISRRSMRSEIWVAGTMGQ